MKSYFDYLIWFNWLFDNFVFRVFRCRDFFVFYFRVFFLCFIFMFHFRDYFFFIADYFFIIWSFWVFDVWSFQLFFRLRFFFLFRILDFFFRFFSEVESARCIIRFIFDDIISLCVIKFIVICSNWKNFRNVNASNFICFWIFKTFWNRFRILTISNFRTINKKFFETKSCLKNLYFFR